MEDIESQKRLRQFDIERRLRERHQAAFVMFGRNGRWGTCASCPRDVNGNVYPEMCEYTERYDHNLTLGSLVEQYENSKKSLTTKN
jgi:hypothetical protein